MEPLLYILIIFHQMICLHVAELLPKQLQFFSTNASCFNCYIVQTECEKKSWKEDVCIRTKFFSMLCMYARIEEKVSKKIVPILSRGSCLEKNPYSIFHIFHLDALKELHFFKRKCSLYRMLW